MSESRRQEMTAISNLLTTEALAELVLGRQPPCLSLYQPTHRRHPENQQDPIRFHNLVRELETIASAEVPSHRDLDDLGELVGEMGGRVLVVPPERMPVRTGLAATYRYRGNRNHNGRI